MDFDEGRDRRRARAIAVAAAVAVIAGLVVAGVALAPGRARVAPLGPAQTVASEAGGDEAKEGTEAAEQAEEEGRRLTVGNVTFTDSQRLSDLPSDEVEGLSDAASAWIGADGVDASEGVEVTSVTNDTVSLNVGLSAGGRSTTVTFDGTTWRYQDDDGSAVEVTESQHNTPIDDADALRFEIGDQAAASLAADFGDWADAQGIAHGSATLVPSKSAPTADGLGISVTVVADDGTQVKGTFDIASSTWSFARA